MEILGIGISELIFVILIALVVLGPRDMQKTGKTIGRWLNKIVRSSEWQEIKNASRKLKTLPNQLMREANLDEIQAELGQYRNKDIKVTMPDEKSDEAAPESPYGAWVEGGNSIAPPADPEPATDKKNDSPTEEGPANENDPVEKENA